MTLTAAMLEEWMLSVRAGAAAETDASALREAFTDVLDAARACASMPLALPATVHAVSQSSTHATHKCHAPV